MFSLPLMLPISLLTTIFLASLPLPIAASPITSTAASVLDSSDPLPFPIEHSEDVETWSIPDMKMNFFTDYTGFNWPYPEDFVFADSELRFTIIFPASNSSIETPKQTETTATCHASWPMDREHLRSGTFPAPEKSFSCDIAKTVTSNDDQQVFFSLKKYTGAGDKRPELGFVVMITKTQGDRQLYGEATITSLAADPLSPTNYLSCLYFQPYQGMKCSMHSHMDNGKNVSIEAARRGALVERM